MKDSKKIIRRRHSAELKAQVLSECARPGASVAGVALTHGINANVVHKWRRLASADCAHSGRAIHSRCIACAELRSAGGHPDGIAERRDHEHHLPAAACCGLRSLMRELLR
jgi:transposase-like protein